MKKLISFLIFPVFLFACTSKGDSESNILSKTSAWTFGNNARIKDSILLLSGNATSANYNKEYKNFELEMECKTGDGAIGGIWIHTNNGYPNISKSGYEILLNNNIEPTEWRKSGSLSTIRNFGKRTAANNEWFPLKIKVTGNLINVWINNVWITEYAEPGQPYRTERYAKRILDKGILSFVSYTDKEISFRNISIKAEQDNLPITLTDIDEQNDDIIRLQQENFPLIDSHVHLKEGWTKAQAAAISRKYGITYAIAPNCGLKFPVTSDRDIYTFLDTMQHQPFYLPMQAEGREWLTLFSEEAMSKFDYRFTDALTWTDNKGRRLRIWIDEETFIEDKQQFMDMLVDRAVTIISGEPVNIFVNPTFIPDKLTPEYEALWTTERMQRIIDACIENNVALEINNRYKIPSARLIKQAKTAGVKFTFGTNNADPNIGKMEYAIEMIKECNLTPEDLYIPPSKNI